MSAILDAIFNHNERNGSFGTERNISNSNSNHNDTSLHITNTPINLNHTLQFASNANYLAVRPVNAVAKSGTLTLLQLAVMGGYYQQIALGQKNSIAMINHNNNSNNVNSDRRSSELNYYEERPIELLIEYYIQSILDGNVDEIHRPMVSVIGLDKN